MIRNQSCSISSRGSELDDRNRKTKNSGKTPCTASPEPVRNPMNEPSDANASAISSASTSSTSTPAKPVSKCRPAAKPDRQVDQRRDQRHDHHPREVPEQHRGALHRRQCEPVQEARLHVTGDRAAGVDRREQRALDERERDREVQIGVGREAGDVRRRVQPADVDPHQDQREEHGRDDHRGLAQRLQDRAPRHLEGLLRRSRPHDLFRHDFVGSSLRPVLFRKTSSSEGWCSCRSATARSAASSARTTATRSSPLSSRTAAAPGGAGTTRPEAAQHVGDRVAVRAVGGHGLDRRAPDLGLQRLRRALGDDVPGVDDPDAVGQHVGLLEVLGGEEDGHAVLAREPRDLGPQVGAADDGSRPVVGSSRNSTRGLCTSASARSSRRFMPPE